MKNELDKLAEKIFIALLQNPERYKYIAEHLNSLTQEEKTMKNIRKSYELAESFINHKDKINTNQ